MLNTWEDKLHDKMTSAYSKCCGTKSSPSTLIQKSIVFKLFHSGERFQKVPFSWIFSFMRISVDGSRIRNNKVVFSNLSGIVWTGPDTNIYRPIPTNGPRADRILSLK